MKTKHLVSMLIVSAALSACGGGGGDTVAPSSTAGTPPATGTPPPNTGTGNIQVSWTPPVEKTDGSALTDLAGYRFFIGTDSGDYADVLTVNNPGLSTYVIDNLPVDTYYVAMTAYRLNGVESDLSNEVIKTAN